MKFKGYIHYRRAVSPVIAVVLLIALTVASAAIIWVVSNDLIGTPNSRLIVEDTAVADVNANGAGDLIRLQIRNLGSDDAIIDGVTVSVDGVTKDTWVLNANSYTVGGAQVEFVDIITSSIADEVRNTDDVIVTVTGTGIAVDPKTVIIPNQMSAIPIFFADSSFTTQGILDQGWQTKKYRDHGGTEEPSVIDGDIVLTTNNDILFWLNNPDYKVKNGIMTMDFEYGDNDGVGLAFRIVDESNYYWIGFTRDHKGEAGGPVFDRNNGQFELHKLVAGVDTLLATGVSTTFTIPTGSISNLQGPYTYILSFSGDTISFQAGPSGGTLDEIITFSGDTTFTDAGFFGAISIAAQNSRLNSFKVTA